MGDALLAIVDDHRQLVGMEAIGAPQDEIANFSGQCLAVASVDGVVDAEFSAVDAQPCTPALAAGWQTESAVAWIDRPFWSLAPLGGDLAASTGAGIAVLILVQALERGLVKGAALALVADRLIPAEPEGLEGVQNQAVGAGKGALLISILDAHQPSAMLVACVGKTADRGDQ